ncbi:MAG: S53 family peptidase [Curvibacter sp.]|nr:S53 family peptidase [Curvibacter sp.]
MSQFIPPFPRTVVQAACWLGTGLLSAGLVACGGGGVDSPSSVQAQIATGSTTLQLSSDELPAEVAAQVLLPAYHLAPVILAAPDDADASGASLSAARAPKSQALPISTLSSRRLTVQAMQAAGLGADGAVSPQASTSAVVTYTPAQIRAAYGWPALPTSLTNLTAAQAAQLGAGQTIYIVDAMNDPNVLAELSAFNQKFGLPACTSVPISTSTSLPLAAPPTNACQISVAYSTTAGALTNTAPAYDSGWQGEIALDVQWAHATAPLARIVLIEAPDSSVNSLLAAVKLANTMGPGVVSMSFGGAEGSWTASVDSTFTTAKMSYVAASGDSGSGVSWPAVSSNVLGVGGTSLTYSGSGARSEVAWSGSGGGTSAYTATPSYQSSAVPGMGTVSHRSVPDVSFNADPNTGQYLAVIPQGSSTAQWLSAGGTSLATPQWAGLTAVANAMRVVASKAVLGAPQSVLYGQVATVAGTYAADFLDITKGSDGSCAICSAHTGYDEVTGLGTPNAASLLGTLSGAAVTLPAPVVTPASISGTVGTALTFTVSVTAPDAVTYALSGAPSGMSISTAGVVSWATPVAGTYSVTVTAKDGTTGLSGQGVYSITIAAPAAPTVTAETLTGKPGVALNFTATFSSPDALTFSLSGAPTGMTINSSTGAVSWPNPVLGTYKVTVSAKDSKTGLSGQAVYTIQIANAGPVITAAAMTGVAGKPMTGTITIADPGASALSVSISGVPLGMSFSANGLTLTANWASPVTGSYTLKIVVQDNAGLSATASVPITVTAH